jgi:hypothetical protein
VYQKDQIIAVPPAKKGEEVKIFQVWDDFECRSKRTCGPTTTVEECGWSSWDGSRSRNRTLSTRKGRSSWYLSTQHPLPWTKWKPRNRQRRTLGPSSSSRTRCWRAWLETSRCRLRMARKAGKLNYRIRSRWSRKWSRRSRRKPKRKRR